MRWARSGGLEVIEKTGKKDFQFPVTADGGRYVFATGRDKNQFQGARLPARLDPILFAYLRRPDDASHTPFRVRGATARWWEGLLATGIHFRPGSALSEWRVIRPRAVGSVALTFSACR